MPKKPKRVSQMAAMVSEITGLPVPTGVLAGVRKRWAEKERAARDAAKNQAAVALGRLGGRKGGKARAERLTPERRSEIAKKAAEARWQR